MPFLAASMAKRMYTLTLACFITALLPTYCSCHITLLFKLSASFLGRGLWATPPVLGGTSLSDKV